MFCAAEVRTRRELKDSTWGKSWDLIIVDMSVSGAQTAEVVRQIREEQREARVIAVAWGRRALRVREIVEAGASGCMTHGCGEELWRQAIEAVLGGRKYVTASLASELVADGEQPHEKLSGRELEVLCCIGEGKTVQQIAAAAGRSEVTVRKTRRSLLKKMKMANGGELIRYALQWGLVE